ncbi:hypothetical protein BLOT_004038, partial [Blomia tropicalis]
FTCYRHDETQHPVPQPNSSDATNYQSILICLLNLSTKVSNSRLIAIAIYFTLAIAYNNYKHITV